MSAKSPWFLNYGSNDEKISEVMRNLTPMYDKKVERKFKRYTARFEESLKKSGYNNSVIGGNFYSQDPRQSHL